MNLADLLKSHGDDAPSGENLEYDPAFIALELAAQPGEERQIGDEVIAATDPDHAEVIAQAEDVLGRSHDARAAVFLAYSLLRTRGFPGLAEATAYLRGLHEQFWDSFHPQLDADDDNDPTMRRNAVLSLAGPPESPSLILRDLRSTPLTDSRTFGRITLRDFLVAEGEIAPSGDAAPPDAAQIRAAFQDTAPERLEAIRAAVAQVLGDVKAIEAVWDDKAPGEGPDLSALSRVLRQILDRLADAGVTDAADATAGETPGDEAPGEDDGGAPAGRAAARGPAAAGGVGAIASQQDVRNALDRLIAYYHRAEPSSPVPMLLERAKRLVGADFLTVIRELAPEGRENVYNIGGIREDEED